jgi:hypothetical protein
VQSAPDLIIGLHRALGDGYVSSSSAVGRKAADPHGGTGVGEADGEAGDEAGDGEAAGDARIGEAEGSGVRRLLLLETKTALLLAQLHPGLHSTDELADEGMQAPSCDAAQLPQWMATWDRLRPFSFSACLDPLVATAAINCAAFASPVPPHARSQLWLHDPCCGSGTILAAALALGIGRVSGSDLRAEFVDGARRNLDRVLPGLAHAVELTVHDATQPFALASLPQPLTAASAPAGGDPRSAHCLVVCNPPWGKHFGSLDDGACIVRSVARQFAGATMCWIVNREAREALQQVEGITMLRHLQLGSVEVAVARSSPAPPRPPAS